MIRLPLERHGADCDDLVRSGVGQEAVRDVRDARELILADRCANGQQRGG